MDNGGTRTIPFYTLVPPHTLLLDIAGPLEVIRYANAEQRDIHFDCRYIAEHDQQQSSIGLGLCGLEALPESLPDNAFLLISGSISRFDNAPEMRRERQALVAWLRRAVRADTTVISICSGALLAGEAGLFDGRSCTTHADCIEALRRTAPLSQVAENRLFVEDGNRFSSAGISTGTDLMLHVVSRLTSPAVAARIAKNMVVYLRRSGNDPQISPWLTGRNHIHPAIHRVQDRVMTEPAQDWSLERLADIAALSERHLSRLFREHTGISVIDYVNLMRVNLARDILANSRLDMETIAERAGFASARHLRRVWQQHNHLPPSHYRGFQA
ncbi:MULTISPECIES: GlxA family transcriptional regulator [Agrobacterium]|uniref:GlxA family transcriptional regulator n=1 Tax=Agrobacterium TaxID=357 RepID=UPI000DE2C6A9|nr:GlxA family transcriptional regulator [Agrobacterium sp. SORGH_AS_0745]MDP9761343.1 transcriptional regulator GlxA family with amidase domain [Agrobacterium tumefaciens]MDQ1221367.1 transcriptional regulator GlxA family with amidase domain [Agrobacterium sp. SORGH_AS_0745]